MQIPRRIRGTLSISSGARDRRRALRIFDGLEKYCDGVWVAVTLRVANQPCIGRNWTMCSLPSGRSRNCEENLLRQTRRIVRFRRRAQEISAGSYGERTSAWTTSSSAAVNADLASRYARRISNAAIRGNSALEGWSAFYKPDNADTVARDPMRLKGRPLPSAYGTRRQRPRCYLRYHEPKARRRACAARSPTFETCDHR